MIKKYTRELLTLSDGSLSAIVQSSKCWVDVLRAVGLSINGTTNRFIKKIVRDLGFCTDHFLGHGHGRGIPKYFCKKIPFDQVFVANSTYTNTSSLKVRIIKENLIPYICSVCGSQPIWQGSSLVLVLDHINGDNRDNRLVNLRFLCPNCNSQQPTFCRSKQSAKRVSDETLIDACKKSDTVREAIHAAGLTDAKANYIRVGKVFQLVRSGKAQRTCVSCGNIYFSLTDRVYCSRQCAGLGNRRCTRPKRKVLRSLVQKYACTTIAKKFGVSDNAVRKWCVAYGIAKDAFRYKHSKVRATRVPVSNVVII